MERPSVALLRLLLMSSLDCSNDYASFFSRMSSLGSLTKSGIFTNVQISYSCSLLDPATGHL